MRLTFAAAMAALGAVLAIGGAASAEAFSPYVDDQGNISIPEGFRGWYFLGTWGVAADEEGAAGSKGFHNVYTQPETVAAFRKTGKFPDGAVLVKELLSAKTDTMTTGEISHATETEGWFVMVKDAKGRFKGNPLWGRGWGWVLYNAEDPQTPATEDFKTECIPCHIPAKKDDWIYVRGYPALHAR